MGQAFESSDKAGMSFKLRYWLVNTTVDMRPHASFTEHETEVQFLDTETGPYPQAQSWGKQGWIYCPTNSLLPISSLCQLRLNRE